MNDMLPILIGWAGLLLALALIVWRIAKAGGSVDVGFHVCVSWGKSEQSRKT